MAQFIQAFTKTFDAEGGLALHIVAGDRGGETCAGISRKYWPEWSGWGIVDTHKGEWSRLAQEPATGPFHFEIHTDWPGAGALYSAVEDFYRRNFWERLKLEGVHSQEIAESIYDFAVNAGHALAVRLAQRVAGTAVDGALGPKTLEALNAKDPGHFVKDYALLKIARYVGICNRDTSQQKFLRGWINRTLKPLEN